MKKLLLLIPFMLTCLITTGQQNFQYYYGQTREAYKSGDFAKMYEAIVKANELHPYHQGALYYRAVAAALTDHPDEAVKFLREALLINAQFDLSLKEFKSISGRQDFEALKQLQQEISKPIIHSDIAFTIKDRTLHIESVAAGEKDGIFYLASIHQRKIVKIDGNGNATDFTKSGQDGMTSVLGIKVDKRKKILWACSSPMTEMEDFDSTSVSSVYKYNLKTGKLLAKYSPDASVKSSVFGDLILNKKGEAFISDTQTNTIFTANETTQKLESYFTSQEFWNIQGITFSEDEKYLFVADYIKGLFRLNTQTKELIQLTKEPEVSLKGIDGLFWYQNSLIGIQNGVSPLRVTRYFLNTTLDNIIRYEIIDRAHPAFNEPTNGCILADALYYVANSQWGGYDNKHQLKPVNQLQDIVILKTDLKKIR
jgi:tetratricopeptide (TPR) repeat protein